LLEAALHIARVARQARGRLFAAQRTLAQDDKSNCIVTSERRGLDREDGLYHNICMAFPVRVCAVCSEEFELRPDKPGFANRCPACSAPENTDAATKRSTDADERKTLKEANEARRQAMRDLLYRKDS
jgi:hypothetical protein